LPLSFTQMLREWAVGHERHLDSLKHKLSQAETRVNQILEQPHLYL